MTEKQAPIFIGPFYNQCRILTQYFKQPTIVSSGQIATWVEKGA